MQRNQKILCVISSLLLICLGLLRPLHVMAADKDLTADDHAVTLPEDYADLAEVLPGEVVSLLPDGFLSQDPEEVLAAAEQMTRLSAMMTTLLSALGWRLNDCLRLFGILVGMILLSFLLTKLKDMINGGSGRLFGFCIKVSLYVAMVALTAGMLDMVTDYFTQLIRLNGGLLPVIGTLYALGGHITQATVNESLLVAHMAVIQYVSAKVTPPVCGLCLATTLLDHLGSLRTSALSGWIRKTYVSLLGLLTFLLSLALGTQTVLAARADDLRMKGIKYAVGSLLPVVGGAVSGTLGTVAVGMATLRSVCGVCGIILLCLLLLPTLVQLLLMRKAIQLAAVMAGLLECGGEARLLEDISSLYGYLAAAVSLCSVLTVFILAILAAGAG